MDNRELKELLTALAEGQSADWNALFCEIEPTIKAICTDFFSGADIAEDAAQDVCLMVYRKTALIAASDAPLQYIKRMTHNHCVDLYRRDKKQAALNDTEQIDETVVAEPHGKSDPQTRFVSGVSDTVAEMIATLPAAQQEVLRLKYNEDLSIREIAQRLQLPEGTVSSRLYYAHHAIEKKVLHYEKKHRIKLRLKIPFALLPWRRLSQKLLLQSSTVTGSTSAADAAKQSAVAAMAVVTGAAALGTGLTHTDFTPQPQPRTIVQEQDTPDTPDRQATVAAAEGGAAENKTVYQDENILLTHNTTVPRDIVVTDTRYQLATAPPEEAATEPAAPHTPRFVGEKYNDTLLHDGRLTVEDVVFNMPAEWVENATWSRLTKYFSAENAATAKAIPCMTASSTPIRHCSPRHTRCASSLSPTVRRKTPIIRRKTCSAAARSAANRRGCICSRCTACTLSRTAYRRRPSPAQSGEWLTASKRCIWIYTIRKLPSRS